MAQSIRDVMTTNPIALSQGASVQDAARPMRDSDIGDVMLLDDPDQVCGIVTDRDIAVRFVAEGKDPAQTSLEEICSKKLQSLSPGDSVGDAVRLMREKSIRRLPILDGGRPVGIVSMGDLAATQDPDSALANISSAPPNN